MPAVVEYELTQNDYVQFNMYYIRHSPAAQRMRRGSTFALVVGVALVGLLMWSIDHKTSTLVAFCIGTVLCALFGNRLWYQETTRRSKKLYAEVTQPITSRNTLEIEPAGLRATGNSGVGTYKWSAVDKIAEDTHHIYMYVGGMSGLIIPNRAFASDEERRRFVEMAREYREAAAGLTNVSL